MYRASRVVRPAGGREVSSFVGEAEERQQVALVLVEVELDAWVPS